MPFTLSCPGCEAKLKATEALVGKTIKCPRCTKPALIRGPAPTSVAAMPRLELPPARVAPAPAEHTDYEDVEPAEPAEELDELPEADDEDDIEEAELDERVKADDDDYADVAGRIRKNKKSRPGVPTKDEKTTAMFIYLSALLLGFFIGPLAFAGPLILWLVKRDESKFIDHHGKEMVNFTITMAVVGLCFSPKLALVFSAIFQSGKELGRNVGSAFWLQIEKPNGFGLKGVGFRQLLERGSRRIRDDLVGVAYARGQVRQQAAKAMNGKPALRLVCFLLCLGRCRRLSRLDRVAFAPILLQFLVGIQQRRQGPPHLPLDVVGQKAQKQMGAHARIDPMMNRPHAQVQPLEATEGLLHLRQALVSADAISRRKGFGTLTRADHVDAVELFLALDRRFVARPIESAVGDLQPEVFSHLVAAQHLPGLETDRRGRQRFLGARRTSASSRRKSAVVASSNRRRFRWRRSANSGL